GLVVDGRIVRPCPVRLLHRQPALQRAQAPVEHELRLVLLRRDEADGLFIKAGRQRVRLDVGDEAMLVAAREHGGKLWIGAHRMSCRFVPATTPLRSRTSNIAKWRGLLSRPASSASEISSRDWRMAWLMRCQPKPTLQLACRSQRLCSPVEHSVRANGPSSASRMAAALIWRAGRARR